MKGRSILVVDGETDSRRHAASILRNAGYDVFETGAAAEALRAARTDPPDVVLVDLALSDADPEQLIRTLSTKHPDTDIMLTTRQHEPPRQYRQLDVSDYIEKPVDAEELLTKTRMLDLRREFHQRFQLLGRDERFIAAMESVLQVAPTGIQVLLTGESGTGKEGFARAIHHFSDRRDGPFIPINCGAIAEGVLESELFGHEKGAFTDAKGQRKGYFEQAHGGTLLLDEIGDMPRSTQVKLLRVLEQQEFIRVGGSTPVKTDVRLIASTNRDLSGDIHDGTFRQDLYYRLNAVHIHLPALRERRDDIPRLIGHFIRHAPGKPGAPPPVFTEEALAALSDYEWPGNIRELRHLIESLVVTSGKARIEAEDLPDRIYSPPMANRALPVPQNRNPQDMDREMFYKILWQILTAIHELPSKISAALGRGPEPLPDRFQLPSPADAEQELETPSSDVGQDLEKPTSEAAQYFDPSHDDARPDLERPAEVVTGNVETGADELDRLRSMGDWEREAIRRALARNEGHRGRAAQELGISERSIYRKIRDYGLDEYA